MVESRGPRYDILRVRLGGPLEIETNCHTKPRKSHTAAAAAAAAPAGDRNEEQNWGALQDARNEMNTNQDARINEGLTTLLPQCCASQ